MRYKRTLNICRTEEWQMRYKADALCISQHVPHLHEEHRPQGSKGKEKPGRHDPQIPGSITAICCSCKERMPSSQEMIKRNFAHRSLNISSQAVQILGWIVPGHPNDAGLKFASEKGLKISQRKYRQELLTHTKLIPNLKTWNTKNYYHYDHYIVVKLNNR